MSNSEPEPQPWSGDRRSMSGFRDAAEVVALVMLLGLGLALAVGAVFTVMDV